MCANPRQVFCADPMLFGSTVVVLSTIPSSRRLGFIHILPRRRFMSKRLQVSPAPAGFEPATPCAQGTLGRAFEVLFSE
jgi:hypothetical protein